MYSVLFRERLSRPSHAVQCVLIRSSQKIMGEVDVPVLYVIAANSQIPDNSLLPLLFPCLFPLNITRQKENLSICPVHYIMALKRN